MSGISPKLPLSRDFEDGYSLNKTLKDVARQNLKMLILTAPGERIMIPDFGVGLRNYLFENATEEGLYDLKNRIIEQAKENGFDGIDDEGVVDEDDEDPVDEDDS